MRRHEGVPSAREGSRLPCGIGCRQAVLQVLPDCLVLPALPGTANLPLKLLPPALCPLEQDLKPK